MKEKVKLWLEQTRDVIIKDNPFLNNYQKTYLTDNINKFVDQMISDSSLDESSLEVFILGGNHLVDEMNSMIDEARFNQVLSIDDFLKLVYLDKATSNDHKSIMGLFDTLLSIRKYDKVIEYLNAVDINLLKDKGVSFTLGLSTNPISPLLRRIPSNENISDYSAKRYDVLTKLNIKCDKPEDYDKIVSSYDNLYIGGAPRENN